MVCELKYHQTHFSQIRSSVYECLAARGPYYHHIKYFYHLLSRLDPVRYFFTLTFLIKLAGYFFVSLTMTLRIYFPKKDENLKTNTKFKVYFKKPVQMFIPHCINYNMDQHQPAVVKSNHAVERQTADNFYGWETEIKPPGPQLKVRYISTVHSL